MQFSRDINGLRAIAVAAVVLFHLQVPGFGGGFAGVDVFFVISGYLMTGIILGRQDAGRFSVWGFYADRARRIVPALVVLCLVLLAVGWFFLLPSDYKKLGKQVGASLGFVSNITFWREAGYFDAVSHRKWLLHTWSLSVEWQFYLLYPLLLVALRRLAGPARLRGALGLLLAASLAGAAFGALDPSASFYLLPTRAWEMLLGGLAWGAVVPGGLAVRRAIEVVGLAAVLGSLALLDAGRPWPDALAIAPTLGTALVLAARREASPLLGHPVAQWLGRCSYSVYLWHWPVVVALTQMSELPAGPRIALGLGLSLGLGALSYRWVEAPTRRRAATPAAGTPSARRRPRAALASAAALATVAGVAAWASDGAPWRFAPAVRAADLEALNGNPYGRGCFATFGPPEPACVMGGDRRTARAELVGDSHALSIATALAAAIPDGTGGGVRFHGYASCPTLRTATYGRSENRCAEFNAAVGAELGAAPAAALPLVVTNNWTSYVEQARVRFAAGPDGSGADDTLPFDRERYRSALLTTLCGFAQGGRPVYVTEPFPQFDVDVPRATAYRLMHDAQAVDLDLDLAAHRRRHAFVLEVLHAAQQQCGVRLLDPRPTFARRAAAWPRCTGGRSTPTATT